MTLNPARSLRPAFVGCQVSSALTGRPVAHAKPPLAGAESSLLRGPWTRTAGGIVIDLDAGGVDGHACWGKTPFETGHVTLLGFRSGNRPVEINKHLSARATKYWRAGIKPGPASYD